VKNGDTLDVKPKGGKKPKTQSRIQVGTANIGGGQPVRPGRPGKQPQNRNKPQVQNKNKIKVGTAKKNKGGDDDDDDDDNGKKGPFVVYAKAPGKKKFPIKGLKPNSPVKTLKRKIEKKTDIPRKKQLLTDKKKKPLERDSKPIKKYGVKNGDTVYVKKLRTKFTKAYGGNGGNPVNSYCAAGKYINYWKIRSGAKVDQLRGRCSDGKWLKSAGGNGGGQWKGRANTQKISVRSGTLIDKFNGRGGNGGGRHTLDCGTGFKISGYKMRAGSLVDKVQLQCTGSGGGDDDNGGGKGCCGGAKLLSKGARTAQSSTGHGGKSSRAVDGKTNGKYGSGSCTHTNKEQSPWWSVDLRRTVAVCKVIVWNRTDCCGSRLNNFSVRVGDSKCGSTVAKAQEKNTLQCGCKKGRKVKVQLEGKDYLTLCEVQVYGKAVKT